MPDCLSADQRALLIEANRLEYGTGYANLSFPAPGAAQTALMRRNELLAALGGDVAFGCGGTKLDMNNLAPGCRICVEGDWSCLFINGRCNARCFYCPSRQDETGLPTTNAVTFRTPADYVAYLEQFGFRGMSLSGGEPLLTPHRTLAFLTAAKRHFGDRLHTWLYTNGTRINRDLLLQLRDAGLDEIRFDIGAINYKLKKPRLAIDLIPTVTVEIPAVPEELPQLKNILYELTDVGVKHLNLHQLRLTPHSFQHFVGRPYTFLHGEKITVLESELTALELLLHAREQQIPLPINYCSFVYKNRYQQAAARQRSSAFMRRPFETLTSAGYLRTLALSGDAQRLAQVEKQLEAAGSTRHFRMPHPSGQRLAVPPESCDQLDFSNVTVNITYAECMIRQTPSCHFPFQEVKLPSGRKLVVERRVAASIDVPGAEIESFLQTFLHHGNAHDTPTESTAQQAQRYECIVEGLQEYY